MVSEVGAPAPSGAGANPLVALIELAHRARAAATEAELAFLLVNDTRQLAAYRQAALWFQGRGVEALSGVVQPEANAPYAHWLERVAGHLAQADAEVAAAPPRPALPGQPAAPQGPQPRALEAALLPPELAVSWSEWWPAHALWLPLAMPQTHGVARGGLLLAGGDPFTPPQQALLQEWLHTWAHAWRALTKPNPLSWRQWRQRWQMRRRTGPWWTRRPQQVALAAALLLCVPVRLSVLAPGELVPAHPAVLRAPLDGVIAQFHVQPNEAVKKGQPLFSFEEAPIASRLEVAQQALSTAEAEYRQFAQMALGDNRSKGQLATLAGRIGEKRAEAEFLRGQFERAHVAAPQDGVALFDEPSEWIGRPVQTGERVMRIAQGNDAEVEAWVAVGDAIPLALGAPVRLYLSSNPFAAIEGRLRYLGHDAVLRPDNTYAYRLRATLDAPTEQRVGLKGTAKMQGEWTVLGYWIFRRPLASIRQYLAL